MDAKIKLKSYKPPGFEKINWTNKDEIISLFPIYVQSQISLARAKKISKNIDIDPYHLKAPFSGHYLLQDSRLLLEANKKHCLLGESGTGKSTLFEELAKGNHKEFPKHLYVHHCQEIEASEDAQSVIDTVVHAHQFRNVIIECEAKLQELVAKSPPAAELEQLQANLDFIKMYATRILADTAYERAAKMLRVLGFDEAGQQKSTNALSGGLRMRVALCAAFFVEADFLLLDEPTNHLDFPSVLWLENRLRAYKGSFILVSHDRNLLQNVCQSCILLEDKKITYFNHGFAEFEKKREKAFKTKADEIDKFMAKYRNVDFSSPIAKEKADKKKWQETYYARQVLLAGKFTFPEPEALTHTDKSVPAAQIPLIDLKDVTFSYNVETGIWIFKESISCTVTATTRMGVMGPNGAGKSTFLKLLTGKLTPVSGTVTTHPTATVAYFAQHTVQDLDLKLTPLEYMISQFPQVEKTALLRSHLGKVGIIGDKAETRMLSLSHGLRSCVVFAKITYICPHLLIMDEPTNFLDMDSIDALIAATNKYQGALLLVSHSRTFLNKCATKFLSVVPGRFDIFSDLKTCERATYQFIEEMESGVKVSTGDLVQKNPSADASLKARTGVAPPEKKDASDPYVLTISSSASSKPETKSASKTVESKESKTAKPKPAETKTAKSGEEKGEEKSGSVEISAEEAKLVGQACLAVWAGDGGRYPSVITKALGNGRVEVSYQGYNETGAVNIKDIIIKPASSSSTSSSTRSGQSRHSQYNGSKGKPQGGSSKPQGGSSSSYKPRVRRGSEKA